jgi:hypothetical protein
MSINTQINNDRLVLEVLAFRLFEDNGGSLRDWQNNIDERIAARNRAAESIEALEKAGVKVSVKSRPKGVAELERLATIPASIAYSDSELS